MSIPNQDLNTLKYWFPILNNAGIPVPETIIVPMCQEAYMSSVYLLSGEQLDHKHEALEDFFKQMLLAAKSIGFPVFIRTDMTSHKHDWENTCYVKDEASLKGNIMRLVEFSEIAGIFGLPCNNWAVRKLLPIKTYGSCPLYSNMPVAKEFRVFVDEGVVQCVHPYWPKQALLDGGNNTSQFEALSTPDNLEDIKSLASRVCKLFDGRWSVDILDTKIGLYVIDMAIAEQSYHWEDCEAQEAYRVKMATKPLDMGL